MSTRQRILRALTAGLPIAVAACGGGALQLSDVTPESVPALEGALAQHPTDAATATRLGVGYFRANQLTEARAILDRAKALNLNAIVLQVRPSADAIYPSKLEPWSEFLTGQQGRAPLPLSGSSSAAIRSSAPLPSRSSSSFSTRVRSRPTRR